MEWPHTPSQHCQLLNPTPFVITRMSLIASTNKPSWTSTGYAVTGAPKYFLVAIASHYTHQTAANPPTFKHHLSSNNTPTTPRRQHSPPPFLATHPHPTPKSLTSRVPNEPHRNQPTPPPTAYSPPNNNSPPPQVPPPQPITTAKSALKRSTYIRPLR